MGSLWERVKAWRLRSASHLDGTATASPSIFTEPRVGTLPGKNPQPIIQVYIDEGCIPCSACSMECPEVFDEVPETAIVRAGAEVHFESRKRSIEDAAYGCPVAVIKVVYADGKGGRSMQFVTLEDETGLCEAVAFPDTFARRRRPYLVGEVTEARGRAVRQDGLPVLELRA